MNKRGFPEQTRNKFGGLQVSIESVVGHLYEEVTIGVGRQAVLPVPVKKKLEVPNSARGSHTEPLAIAGWKIVHGTDKE